MEHFMELSDLERSGCVGRTGNASAESLRFSGRLGGRAVGHGRGRRGLSVQADEAFEVALDHLGDHLQSGDEAELLEVIGVEAVDRAQADGADEDQATALLSLLVAVHRRAWLPVRRSQKLFLLVGRCRARMFASAEAVRFPPTPSVSSFVAASRRLTPGSTVACAAERRGG